ncbi:MAG: type II toxin-antitoxin system HicA family toxin [Chloroflexi bacterium]|nr:type II toxin-antitoxin system HicA family toxin [Chloroflexota bacterium]
MGYDGPVGGGRHIRMVHPQKRKVVPLPAHRGKDVGIGLIRTILKEIEVSPDEWNEL